MDRRFSIRIGVRHVCGQFQFERNIHRRLFQKDSNCEYRTENEVILARCQIQIYSYGTERQVTVRPLSVDVGGRVIDFEPKVVPVRPRGQIEIRETFDGFLDQPDPSYSMSGGTNKPGIELIVDGRSKQVK